MTTVTNQLDALRQIFIIYCTDADKALNVLLEESLLYDSWLDASGKMAGNIAAELGGFNDLFSKDDLETRWETNTDLSTYDVQLFDSEIKTNLLNNNAADRALYMKIVDSDIGGFLHKGQVYYAWCDHYSVDFLNKNVLVIDILEISKYLKSIILNFRNNLELLGNLLKRVNEVVNRYSNIFDVNKSQPEPPTTVHKQPTEPEKSILKNLPPKILLLDQLGFFKLPEVQKLSYESKGRLVSALCGGSADNAVDYIRQCDPDRKALEKNPYRNPANVKAVQELINSLNGG